MADEASPEVDRLPYIFLCTSISVAACCLIEAVGAIERDIRRGHQVDSSDLRMLESECGNILANLARIRIKASRQPKDTAAETAI